MQSSLHPTSNANERTAGAIILRIAYGYKVKEHNDPFVELADKAAYQFSLATEPGAYLVDVLPMCKYLVYRTPLCYNDASSATSTNLVPWCCLPQNRKGVGCYSYGDDRSTVQLGEARNGIKFSSFTNLAC